MSTEAIGESLFATIIIPARLNSTRLSRKLLLDDTGKPVIQHTYEGASRSTLAHHICVATDSHEIAEAVRRFGGNVELTSADHVSGSDRIAEVALRYPEFNLIVNVQGDEPEIAGRNVDQVITVLTERPDCVMSTLATPIRSKDRLCDPSCVKVVFNKDNLAIYFSRSAIPYARDWNDALLTAEPPHFYQHIGIYAYRREFLLSFKELPRPPLEQVESLEQLRVLYAGFRIAVGVTNEMTLGIDTEDDYKNFARRARG